MSETKTNNGLYAWLEKTVVPFAKKLQEFKYIQAIRASFLEIISFIIIGSFFTLIRDFPYTADLVAPIAKYLSVGITLTTDFVALYLAYSFGTNLGREYGLDTKITALMAAMTFLFATQTELVDGVFSTKYMGCPGLFVAILFSAYAVEIYRFCDKHEIYIHAPKGCPPAIVTFFKMLVPQIIIVFPVWIIVTILGIDIAGSIFTAFGYLANTINNVWAFMGVTALCDNAVWFFGIHPWSILGGTFIPLVTANTLENAALLEAGQEMKNIVTVALYSGKGTGGTGSTFMICVFCLLSHNKRLRTIGAVSILPTSCHINEPILFGLPIILNPIWFIPFVILEPLIVCAVVYGVTALGWVSKAYIPFMGFLPGPFVWYFGTLDWRSIPWGIISGLVIPGLIYYPFFKIQERMEDEEDARQLAAEQAASNATV